MPSLRQILRTLLVGIALTSPGVLHGQAMRPQGDTIQDFVRRASQARPQPGDRVWLHIWREAKLTDTVMVDERGDVSLPKVGVINASSMTIGQFRDSVRGRFAEFYRDTPVDLVVLRRVSVNGSVKNPNLYYVDVSATLRDVIALAGGVTDDGDRAKVAIVRGSERIPVPGWEQDRSSLSDIRSGDQITVAQKPWLQRNLLSVVSVGTVVASLIISLTR